MKRKNVPVLAVGLMMVMLLIVRCAEPLTPIVGFVSPSSSIPFVAADDPLDTPIQVDVAVNFPPTVEPCAGLVFPVKPETLQVTLKEMNDRTVVQEWPIDASTWWNETFDAIAGQITIGGETSGQSWAVYRICVSISNDQGPIETCSSFRVEKPITELTGGAYNVTVTGFNQSPPSCVLPQIAIGVVNDILAQQDPIPVAVPSASGCPGPTCNYPTSITLSLPEPLGVLVVDVDLDEVSNRLVFDPVSLPGIDLGPYNIPTFNCLVGGTANGAFLGEWDESDLDGIILVDEMSVGVGSGSGGCNLSDPPPECTLTVTLDGDRII